MNASSHLDAHQADEILSQTRYEIYVRLLPVIICMTIFGAVGIVGNIMTIIFYTLKTKRSPSQIQIISLATADLLVSLLVIANILEMVANVAHNHPILCKFAHFFGLWAIGSSCLILWVVAIDRHKKICKPFAKQMTIKLTKIYIAGVVIFCFCLSVRNFANFDTVSLNVKVTRSNRTIYGRFCTTRDDDQYKLSVTIFTAVDFAIVFMVWLTLIIVYPHIVYTLIKIKRKKTCMSSQSSPSARVQEMRDLRAEDPETSFDYHESVEYKTSCVSNDNMTSDESFDTSTTASQINQHRIASPNPSEILRHRLTRLRRRRKRKLPAAKSSMERSITFMMLTVSVFFVLCFSPYFVIKIIMRLVLHSGEEFELGIGTQLCLRLVYLNSVVNPIAYCVFNPKFRRYIKAKAISLVRMPHTVIRNSLVLK